MSTYKRSTGNIVFETLNANSSVSFIGPTANAVSVVINGDLSVSGNASLTGNIAGDNIFNGTSSIQIPTANGNIVMNAGGVSNVVVVSPTGVTFAGAIGFSGNVSAGNLAATGIVTAVGNINSSANINSNGNIIITRDASVGQPTFRFNDTDTTITTNTVIGAVEWFTNDAAGARVTTAVRSIATSATGNARYEVLTSTNGAAATAKFAIDDVGNVGVANTAPLHTFAVSGNTFASGTATVIGNVTGGNFITAGLVSATGNITSAANIAGGNLAVTSNVTANNLSATTGISAGVGGITATGNIRGGNLISDGIISATGNLTTTDIFSTTLTATGNVRGANLNVGGVANAGSVTATSTISATGNVTGGNIGTAGRITATGNIVGGNVSAGGIISAAGNIVAGAFFVGDGGFLSNVTAVSNLAVSQLANGITNLTVRSSTGPITADVNGTANVLIITDTSLTMSGIVSATGNVVAGNVNTAGIVSATGNINGGNVNATFGNFNTVIGQANASNLTTGTVPSDRLTGIYAINVSGYSATVSAAAQPNITSLGTLTALSVTGNITGGNVGTAGLITATGNITGGNVNTARVVANSFVSATGNVVGGNVNTGGLINATGNIVGGNISTAGLITATGNIVGGNISTAGLITATGNITGGNIIGTTVSVSGNVIGANIVSSALRTPDAVSGVTNGINIRTGNSTGSSLTGAILIETGANTFASGDIRVRPGIANAAGTARGGNVFIEGGTVNSGTTKTGGNVVIDGGMPDTESATVFAGNVYLGTNYTPLGAGTNSVFIGRTSGQTQVNGFLSVVGNVTGGNLVTAGQVSATGNVSGNFILGNGALLTGVITSVANINFGNSNVTVVSSGGNVAVGVGGTANVLVVANTGAVVSGTISASGTVTVGNLSTAGTASATGNITGGNLSTAGTASATGNITGGNLITAGQVSATGAITGGSLSVSTGNITSGNLLISGAIIDSAQLDIQTSTANANIVLTPNGTGNVNIGRMSASGNITAVAFFGNGAGLTSLGAATTAGTVTTNAQPNITSVGTLSSLAVTANITGGNLSVSTGTITAGNIVNSNANGIGNIGSSTIYFNRIFATATTALYADLAEKFLADQLYGPGTVLVFGGEKEVTESTTDADYRVAGVVSTNPSYIMNSGLGGDYAVELALQGRVPCAVIGPVAKGDLIVSAPNGRARAVKSAAAGTIIGKSLENFNGEFGVVEIVVGRD
jgi:hypothetical protein